MKKGRNNAQKVFPGTPLGQKIEGLRIVGFTFKEIEELVEKEVTFATASNHCRRHLIEVV